MRFFLAFTNNSEAFNDHFVPPPQKNSKKEDATVLKRSGAANRGVDSRNRRVPISFSYFS